MLPLGRPDGMYPGRDQLVYSPEITIVHRLLQDAYKKLRPAPNTLIVASPFANGYHFGYVSPRKFARRPFSSEGFPVWRTTVDSIPAENTAGFIVLEEPYFGSDRLSDRVPPTYRAVERTALERRGYSIQAIRYEKRVEQSDRPPP